MPRHPRPAALAPPLAAAVFLPVVAAVFAAALITAVPARAVAAPPLAAIALIPCQLSPAAGSPVRAAARCGTLTVPEAEPAPGEPDPVGGRTISLRVAVVEAVTPKAAPDPIFMLAGGPGQAATEAFPAIRGAFGHLLRQREVVLVDQRGTGGSGRLTCPDEPSPPGDTPSPERQAAQVRACAATLSAKVDLLAYSTAAAARDLDRVRAALGYERINLVGFSYGTRLALAYLREFPARVRTLVLDGVAPFQLAVGSAFEADARAAVDALLARCRDDAACRRAFPDLPGELDRLLARLEAAPVEVAVRDPLTGAPRARAFGPDELRSVLFSLAYAAETAALLPPLLHAAAAGDLAPLAGALEIVSGDFAEAVARPLQLSVVCSEDVPFYPPAPRGERWFGTRTREEFQRMCAAWPSRPVAPAARAPFRSEVPSLLLSGEADPVTPPRWAALLLPDLPRARHLVLHGQGHGTLFRGCLPRVAAAFVESGTADGLDAACVERVRPAAPFLDGLGGPP